MAEKRKQWKLSASSIACFKMCPYKYYLHYIKGIRKAVDPDHFRIGTNWHTIMEILSYPAGGTCKCVFMGTGPAAIENCVLCEGTGSYPEDLMDAAIRVIDLAYSVCPGAKDPTEWMVERSKLLYAAAGYNWYYGNNPLVPIFTEFKFRAPLPGLSGRAVPNLLIDGMIDKVIDAGDVNRVVEHKTTSSSVATDSDFWSSLNLDTQTTLYIYMTRLLREKGKLPKEIAEVDGFVYDAFHKPTIKAKQLSIADGKKFVETGMYFEQQFEVRQPGINPGDDRYYVDDVVADVEPAAKAGQFKFRETPDMYGARLLADIATRPEFYFARREYGKTDDELNRFHRELLAIFGTIRTMYKDEGWYHCEKMCENTFKCEFIDICYNGVDPDGQLPEGLVCKHKQEKESKDGA